MGITRRTLLKGGALSAAAYVTGMAHAAPEHELDCLVLGAGISGLVAADRLARAGKKVLILEASDRAGGRILTSSVGIGTHVELGAQYIHRPPTSGLPLWEEIQRFGLSTREVPRSDNGVIYHSAWGEPKSFVGAAIAAGLVDIASLFQTMDGYTGPDCSLQGWLNQYPDPVVKDMVSLALGMEMPGPEKALSIHGLQSDQLCEMEQESFEYALNGGYTQLVSKLAAHSNIRFKQFVEHIEYGKNGVTVTTQDGNVYSARTAVFTFALGMLKSGKIKFTPELPKYKTQAMNFVHAGHESKVSIRFTQKFWPADVPLITRCDQQRRAGRVYFEENFGLAGKPPVIIALMSGDDGARLHHKSDKDVLQRICADLNEIYPVQGGVYRLVARHSNGAPMMARKQWMDDPYSLGGTTYVRTDPTGRYDVRKARTNLATSYKTDPLFWAGEATTVGTQPSSVHGAHWTGVRASMEVLHRLKSGR